MAIFRSLILCLLAASLLLTGAARAQGSTPAAGDPPPFTAQELDSLLAPIALYPDALLAQVLMASTYPLEVVSAARWVKANPDVKGDAALKKVENETWDVSVKSLAAFPSILDMMNEKLDWTQKLGDAFLAQQKEVLASVQRLRQLAKNSGNLESNQQQVVRSEAQSIIIEPAQPQTIYVPSYNPTVVYGTWPYPAYPPYYYPPNPYYYPGYYPGAALATGLAWGVGIAAGAALIGGANWGGGDVTINANRAANIDRNYSRSSSNSWQHNSQHRGNAGYRDSASQQKFGSKQGQAQRSRDEFRGREGGDRGGDRGGRDGAGGDRGGAGDRGGIGGDHGGAGNRGGAGGAAGNRGGGNAFDGVNSGSRDATRGHSSAGGAGRTGGSSSFGGGGGSSRSAGAGGGGGRSFSGGGGRAGGGGGRGGGGRR
jgi:hypothetical protein